MSHVSAPLDRSDDALQLDVAIIGGGLGGLYALHRMRGLGFRTRAFERGSDVGGTWFWNKYPGARCAIEPLEYSYSLSDDLPQKWNWPGQTGKHTVQERGVRNVV